VEKAQKNKFSQVIDKKYFIVKSPPKKPAFYSIQL